MGKCPCGDFKVTELPLTSSVYILERMLTEQLCVVSLLRPSRLHPNLSRMLQKKLFVKSCTILSRRLRNGNWVNLYCVVRSTVRKEGPHDIVEAELVMLVAPALKLTEPFTTDYL
jgi:hypothetical protein